VHGVSRVGARGRRGWCKGSAGVEQGVSMVGARGRRGWCKGSAGVVQGVSVGNVRGRQGWGKGSGGPFNDRQGPLQELVGAVQRIGGGGPRDWQLV
jgi:hypothetical protein